ncbi:HK97 family phage prohead protease [Shimia sp. R11_0]|uniref:HK97 family phage prohead protease n=1 Tax=Shimia sp. R11_0 TaxID=2821096 RepID=UPI001ADA5B50|nr:HK97 family phage prohead protease [Shimia sp. R11_0]MBO9478248.1 HK97 family phage prohead protease [Shimia sp. R11_0]
MTDSRTIWAANLEVRQQGKSPVIAGSFPYNTWAVLSDRGTVRKEEIEPGAFDFTLQDATREINLLFGHSFDKPLASRKAGSLVLKDTPEALTFEATISPELEAVSHVRDALSMVGAGLVTGVSPGFRVPPKVVVPDAERLEPEPGNPGVMIRKLSALVLFELSLVTRPAYEQSHAELRALERAQLHQPTQRIFLP